MEKINKKAIIIGAGPAGLSCAYELVKKSKIKAIIYEKLDVVGGISRTIEYKGYKFDIGPHRFYTKSTEVSELWESILPLQGKLTKDDEILGRKIELSEKENAPDPEVTDKVILRKNRLTRILFLRKFFDYPISLSFNTLINLGFLKVINIFFSYLKVKIFPIKEEKSLEDFFINHFGYQLYLLFFKDYSEKVWGLKCSQMSADWGSQRIKKLSISKIILHAFGFNRGKRIQTSLVESFLFPKLGAGQMYSAMAERVIEEGKCELHFNSFLAELKREGNKIIEARFENLKTGEIQSVRGDYFISSVPVVELINCLGADAPSDIKRIAQGLIYRDYIIVGMIVKKMKMKNDTKIKTHNDIIPDNWIYIQERDVKIARLDIVNNFSSFMLPDKNKIVLGLEYYCNENDNFWEKKDEEIINFGTIELEKLNIINKEDVIDATVVRVPKAYPTYYGTYSEIGTIKNYLEQFENLFLIGRNGLHRYNNMDHSILTGMTAARNIIKNVNIKNNIWSINTEEEFVEEKYVDK